jgi:hypothetical protein
MRHGVISVEADDPALAAADLMVETAFRAFRLYAGTAAGRC